ncbi:MAG: hypothetical protein NTY22_00970 [Proteobacteria bacterium]|nr:hypothetical protein [Pseudomonadota bacterium]
MKKLFLLGLGLCAFSLSAVTFTEYATNDYNDIKGAVAKATDNCVKTRYTNMSTYLSTNVINNTNTLKTLETKVQKFCKDGTGGEKINYVKNGKLTIYTGIVLHKLPSTFTTNKGDTTGSVWFVEKDQCKDLVFNTTK